ncbi:MAG: Fe2+-dependent dioxygenase [Erythrobacter sp.]|jgi:PKHD-type hydroxylase
MILLISAIPDAAQRAAITEKLALLEWRDGAATAGPVARAVKHNLQAAMNAVPARTLAEEVQAILAAHPVLRAAAQPRRFSNLIISKTQDGGHYGLHVDNAVMKSASGEAMRTDLSFTLFLTPPEDYDGGELVIHSASGADEVKGAPGELVLYPSTALHEVRPVTRGQRIVCVGWIESMVADAAAREILFDLENLRVALRARLPGQAPESLTLDKTIANLLRRWARP